MSYKAIFTLGVAQNWDIDYINVKIAFLYELIEEIICVIQLTGYSDRSS